MPVQILGEERCIEVGDYGFPCLGVLLQKLENPALRSCLKVPSNEGVLVRRVEPTSGASKVLKELSSFVSLNLITVESLFYGAKRISRIIYEVVVIDNESCKHAAVIQPDSVNEPGIRLEVVQVLTDLNLTISKAYISSDGGWFVNVFNVTDQDGNEITEVDALRPDSSNFGYSIRISVGVKSAMVHIVIELIRFDKPGLLSELCALLNLKCNVVSTDHAQLRAMPVQILGEERCIEVGDYGLTPHWLCGLVLPEFLFVYPFVINGVLTDLNLTISKAYISSDGGWFVNVFNVTDQGMNEITEVDALGPDSNSRYSIRRLVGVKSALVNTAIELIRSDKPRLLSELSALLTHLKCNVVSAEMWTTHNTRAAAMVLHQMMFADWDYERYSDEVAEDRSRPEVNVIN
ncbi:hypothetical protein POM88_022243 [Heracleum sosnowskyi]|uniref:ACT domain-containing protein ACR n=1 Tax=Heracleum sosnowskyi TaxID=360622 RepID=A0AAD8IHE2_9APIA|nr:hypothetical protein POM88_022243 [Heracleum sosnowskyi]